MNLSSVPAGPGTRLRWKRLGLVHRPDTALEWVADSALNPTPLVLDDATIRVYVGSRDEQGRSRPGWVDLDAREPRRVLQSAETPALDLGEPGEFDDSGVVPCAVVRAGEEVRLYYTGYQLLRTVRFSIFSGMAVSRDGGTTFTRVASTPVMDRVPGESKFRGISAIHPEGAGWRAWYAAGSRWNEDGDRPTPHYDVRTTTSPDGVRFNVPGHVCLPARPDDLRVSRPTVVRAADAGSHMLFSYQRAGHSYRTGYAWSADGRQWERDDGAAGLEPPAGEWDGEMLAFGSILEHGGRTLFFYCGNGMGREGFGVAELEDVTPSPI